MTSSSTAEVVDLTFGVITRKQVCRSVVFVQEQSVSWEQ
jgi:hypothetical protein